MYEIFDLWREIMQLSGPWLYLPAIIWALGAGLGEAQNFLGVVNLRKGGRRFYHPHPHNGIFTGGYTL